MTRSPGLTTLTTFLVLATLASCGRSGVNPAGPTSAAGANGGGANGGGGGGVAGGNGGDATTTGASGEGGAAGGDAGPDRDGGNGGAAADAGTSAEGGGGSGGTGTPGGGGGGGTGGFRECSRLLGADDSIGKFVVRTVLVRGLAGVYLPGGQLAESSGQFDFTNRPYSVRLPATYDHALPSPVIFEAGGCGSTAANFASFPTSYFQIDPQHQSNAIEIGLANVSTCFADGGPRIDDRPDSPEVQYFRAVLDDIEARYCVDRGRVFVAGTSSGAWEADLLGCAAADVVRGTATMQGGLRAHRPACTGPVAAIFVADAMDSFNPLGPLDPSSATFMSLDSPGLIPMRDDVLTRNGCVGGASQPWDARFPLCVTFTGCPEAHPVVWCELDSSGQNPGVAGGIQYSPKAMWPFLGALPPIP
jgi:hypothetical protein